MLAFNYSCKRYKFSDFSIGINTQLLVNKIFDQYFLTDTESIQNPDELIQRWILKNLVCLAASPKSVMVASNSAPNFGLEDFFSS